MKFCKLKFKILAAVLLLIIILCAVFIRIVPDYSTSRGFAIVSLSDYDKYKQGYCLKEDRILPKEELYKKVAGAYLDYDIKLDWMIDDYKFKTYGSFWHSRYEVAYYELENINLSNCFEVIRKILSRGKNDGANTHKRAKSQKNRSKEISKNKFERYERWI